jgi:2-oxoglutarate dehydrogenase E2 component (dihydrolipoamide succinyltransferase)
MTDVIMPQMGESIAEGTITKWLKSVGDKVERDEPLFEISTDKVDAEIPAPAQGVLAEIRFEAGATVAINTVVAVIGAAGTQAAVSDAPATAMPAPPVAMTAAAAPAVPPPVFQLEPPTLHAVPPPPPAAPARPAPAPSAPPAVEKARSEMTAEELRQSRSSPVVRRIAAEHNVDVRAIQGTGISGRVTKQDILEHIEGRSAAPAPVPAVAATPAASPWVPAPSVGVPLAAVPPAAAPTVAPASTASLSASTAASMTPLPPTTPAPAAAPAPAPAAPVAAVPPPAPSRPTALPPPPAAGATPTPGTPTASSAPRPGGPGRIEVVPMSPIRRKTAEHMVLSQRTSAHVSTVFEVDMTHVARLRAKYRAGYEERSGVKLTYLPFILKATVDALKAFPVLNASIDGENILYRKDINLGIAVALDWGLIVPVIHGADEKNVLGLARSVADLAERARAKKLKIEEVQGGTFTLTNPGVFGSLFGTPIINQPQVGILGIGTIEKRPVVRDEAIAIRTMCYVCLSFDHRLVDGADADRFMSHLKKGLEEFDESGL